MSRQGAYDKVVRVEFEDIYDDENLDKCPGFMRVGRETQAGRYIEALVQCDKAHAHQQRRKVVTFESGRKETQLVTGWKQSLKTMWDVGGPMVPPPVSDAAWRDTHGLEYRDGEALPDYAARCLALMAVRAGSKGGAIVATLARTAKVSAASMQKAMKERIALERTLGGSESNAPNRAKQAVKSIPDAFVDSDPYDMLESSAPSPNVASVPLPSALETSRTNCRCGRRLITLDWSRLGVSGNPKACPKCRDFPEYCHCQQA